MKIKALSIALSAMFFLLTLGCSDRLNKSTKTLYEEASQTFELSEEGAASYSDLLVSYYKARSRINKILTEYPTSDIALGIKSGEILIADFTLSQFQDLETSLKELEEAEREPLSCALFIAKTIEDADNKFIAIVTIAGRYAENGQTEQALQLLSEALLVAQTREWPDMEVLCAIAFRYAENGQKEKAEKLLSQAFTTTQTVVRTYDGVVLGNTEYVVKIASAYAEIGYFNYALEVANSIECPDDKTRALIEIGLKHAKNGQKEQAAQALQRFFETTRADTRSTGAVKPLVYVAGEYAKIGQNESASELLSEALKRTEVQAKNSYTGTFWNFAAIAGKYAELGNFNRALEIARTISNEINRSNALVAIAGIYVETGQKEHAELVLSEAFDAAIEGGTFRKLHVLTKIAEMYVEIGDLSEALRATRAIEHSKDKSLILAAMAGKFTEAEQNEQALQLLSQVFDNTLESSTRCRSKALGTIAMHYAQNGDLESATLIAKRIDSSSHRSIAFTVIGGRYLENGEKLQAAQSLSEALQAAELIYDTVEKSNTILRIADIYAKNEQEETAIQILSQALETAQTIENNYLKPGVLVNIAGKYAETGQIEQSLLILTQAFEIAKIRQYTKKTYNLLRVMAGSYAKSGNFDQAVKTANTIEDSRFKSRALVDVAAIYVESGESEKATELFSQAHELANTIRSSDSKCWALVDIAGNYAESGLNAQAKELLHVAHESVKLWGDKYDRARTLADIARTYAQIGDFQKATAIARVVEYPDFKSRILTNIAEILAEAGYEDKVFQLLAEAELAAIGIKGVKTRLSAQAKIAESYASAQQIELAEALLSRSTDTAAALVDADDRSEALALLAEKYAVIGENQTATQLLFKATLAADKIKNSKPNSKVLRTIAERYAQIGDLSQALKAAKTIAPSDEKDKYIALTVIAERYAQAGQMDQARQLLSEALETARTISRTGDQSEALLEIATIYFRIGEKDEAEILLDEALVASTMTEESKLDPWVLSAIAHVYAKTGAFDRAISMAKAFEDRYYRTTIFAEIAGVLIQNGQKQQAAHILSDALKIAITSADAQEKFSALVEIADQHVKAEQKDQAATILSQALEATRTIQNKDDRSRALRTIASKYAEAGYFSQAIKTAEMIESLHTDFMVITFSKIADEYAENGQNNQALSLLLEVLDAAKTIENPSSESIALVKIAGVYARAGQKQKALQYLQETLDMIGNQKPADFTLLRMADIALGYAALGDKDQASQIMSQAFELAMAIEERGLRNLELSILARTYAEIGDFSEALATTRLIATGKTTESRTADSLGAAFDKDFALACITEKVTELSKDDRETLKEITHALVPLSHLLKNPPTSK